MKNMLEGKSESYSPVEEAQKAIQGAIEQFKDYGKDITLLVEDVVVNKNTENIFKLIEDRTAMTDALKTLEESQLAWRNRHGLVKDGDKAVLGEVKKMIAEQVRTGKETISTTLKLHTELLNTQNTALQALAEVEINNPHVATRITAITGWMQSEITKTQQQIVKDKKAKNEIERAERSVNADEYCKNTLQMLDTQIAHLKTEIQRSEQYILVENEIIQAMLPRVAEELLKFATVADEAVATKPKKKAVKKKLDS